MLTPAAGTGALGASGCSLGIPPTVCMNGSCGWHHIRYGELFELEILELVDPRERPTAR